MIISPPSTTSVCPVMKEDSEDARNAATEASAADSVGVAMPAMIPPMMTSGYWVTNDDRSY